MERTWILMNKPVYLGLSIIEISKKVIHEFWYDHVKPKYGEKTKLCYGYRQFYSLDKIKIFM